jgi:tRNA pseudouridine55 synthase
MFSALKKNGVPLYRLARQGHYVEREKRKISVEDFHVELQKRDEVSFHALCSRGAYLRSLAADIGVFLGCGAHLLDLRRLACGTFRVDDAVSPDAVRERKIQETLRILPMRDCIRGAGEVTLSGEVLKKLVRGERRILTEILHVPRGRQQIKILDEGSRLVALIQGEFGTWKILRVFQPS